MNKFTLRLADGRWVSSPTNAVTDNPNLAGVFTAADDESAAELRGAMERLHGPLEIVPWQSNNHDRIPPLVTLKAVCGPRDIDDPHPAITVMLPDED